MKTDFVKLALAVVLMVVFASGIAFSAGSSSSRPSSETFDYAKAQKAVDSGNYRAALAHLERAMESHANKADVHNLLGYSHRKLGNTEKAFEHYNTALKMEPDHRGANEYIGELYLETGQPEKAQERLQVLDKACLFGCEEYDELKAAIEAFKSRSGSGS